MATRPENAAENPAINMPESIAKKVVFERKKPSRILIYGEGGVGKTTFASKFPKPIFIATDPGCEMISCLQYPIAESFLQFKMNLDEAVKQDCFSTIVIDSLTYLELLIDDYVCKKHKVTNLSEIGNYSAGYVEMRKTFSGVIETLEAAVRKGFIVVATAHTRTEYVPDYDSEGIDKKMVEIQRIVPSIDKKCLTQCSGWFDSIIFARVANESFNGAFGVKKGSSRAATRTAHCTPCNAWLAKNRQGIEKPMLLDGEAFVDEYVL